MRSVISLISLLLSLIEFGCKSAEPIQKQQVENRTERLFDSLSTEYAADFRWDDSLGYDPLTIDIQKALGLLEPSHGPRNFITEMRIVDVLAFENEYLVLFSGWIPSIGLRLVCSREQADLIRIRNRSSEVRWQSCLIIFTPEKVSKSTIKATIGYSGESDMYYLSDDAPEVIIYGTLRHIVNYEP